MAASASFPVRSPGRPMLRKPLPAMMDERTRNSRRVRPAFGSAAVFSSRFFSSMMGLLHQLRGALDGADDARVRGAAAQVAVHVRDDLFLGRGGIDREQRGRL